MNTLGYFNIEVFGCQMNEHDAEVLRGMLSQMGYEETSSEEEADVLLLNTCAVREKAEHKVLAKIGMLKELKEKKPNMVIGICGCMVQQQWMADKIKRDFHHIDLVFGTHNLHYFPHLFRQVVEEGKRVFDVWESESGIVEELPKQRTSGIKAWVVITYGCNNFCSYCIVPYVRGRERSRKIEDIEKEVLDLASKGFKEVTLLGQNVDSYGKDMGLKGGFTQLLKRLDEIDGIERIRFMTSHPRDFDEELIEFISKSKRVCEHIHLPIQAGSNNILKKMNRGYTKEEYMELIERIREYIPHVSVTTDIMVGFPGESEEDFNDTLDVVKKVRFDNAYTFVYSKRKGTPAAEMEDQVDEKVKKERIQKLISEQQQISLEINKEMMGKTFEILVEGTSKNDSSVFTGRTRTNKIVHFRPNNTDNKDLEDNNEALDSEKLVGNLVNVKITEAKSYTIFGSLQDGLLGGN
ncbi:tRNA (N6-isopentenyl adenosine(37)-C2)-methylthiotransferase MiaB [Natranaerofaba carboxydovora]|uniref:tRNA (N6-isopentenyl adenosine(37)-C2)-methylthiotransferase MiaB n=1 Tax=Natranaerofaba carboxydovora TaxID=2742683 RepID=UPI001F130C67|nr:tRNA (N6-isopentenyl adenosine(37)-C2)-methylthiotransferase MiaB [Natranaerofaba carboxydovora]UMZ73522.1 tRNA-2-methylthio-N(6)-dimethylallyladenosine synthase [Natranaerofaba carboxydovora]